MEGCQSESRSDSAGAANFSTIPERMSGCTSNPETLKMTEDISTTNHNSQEEQEEAHEQSSNDILPNGGQKSEIAVKEKIQSIDFGVDGSRKKKKKKNKSKGQRAAKAGTGFEEYYADAPLSPEKHEEEKSLYHQSLPVAQRIETAIQRYAAKRNMDAIRKDVFDKYLAHGGIDAGPKMFSGGLDSQTMATGDAQDIALLNATNFVPFDKADPRNNLYVVDFPGCLKAFLSYKFPNTFDLTSEEYIKSLIHVIRNFLNYLLHHDVCPEYKEQIELSKKLCDQGERELWAISCNIVDLPGMFNKACSELYGGIFQGQWSATSTWLSEEENASLSQGISPALARQAFQLGIVANSSEEQFKAYEMQIATQSISITSVDDIAMEVVETIPSNVEVQALYARGGGFKPVGEKVLRPHPLELLLNVHWILSSRKLLTKTWHSPFVPPEDLTEEEELSLAHTSKPTKFYEFWIEDDILRNCFPSMKLDVTVSELSIGVSYFDKIHGVYCSFFSVSANQRMAGWREPEGEGNWLPPRATEDGSLGEDEGEEGDDAELGSNDVDNGAPTDPNETHEKIEDLQTSDSKLARLQIGDSVGDGTQVSNDGENAASHN